MSLPKSLGAGTEEDNGGGVRQRQGVEGQGEQEGQVRAGKDSLLWRDARHREQGRTR